MSRLRPSFPPDVAAALQRPEGRVSVRYTLAGRLNGPPEIDMPLMETPYQDVLAALTLDTKGNLRFVRTGSRREGARVAIVDVGELIGPGRHWDIELAWDAERLAVEVRDRDDSAASAVRGTWPASYGMLAQ